MSGYKNIPSLDLLDFTQGNLEKKEKFVNKLGEAYEEVGFLSLKNYGLNKSD